MDSKTLEERAEINRARVDAQLAIDRKADRLFKLKQQVGPVYCDCRIDNFIVSTEPESLKKQSSVMGKLASYSGKQIDDGVNIGFIGTVGTGKDHLMCAMMFRMIEHTSHSVEWIDTTTLLRDFRSCIDGDQSEESVLNPLVRCDVLALSDVVPPCSSLSPFAREKLFALIDARYRQRKPIWWSLNVKQPSEAEEMLTPQIYDRLTDGALLLFFDWSSFRRTRRWNAGDAQ